MIVKKAGTILLNLETKQIGLVYRKIDSKYSFPKGHLEEGETLQECAVRETEEETLRRNHLLNNKEIYIDKYVTSSGEKVENYMYITIDDGPTNRDIPLKDREILEWVNLREIENKLSYDSLKKLWNKVKFSIKNILDPKEF